MSGLKLAIWDVDGTLIDSRHTILRAAVEGAKAINIEPPTYDQVRAIVGVSLFEALAMMRPDLDELTIADYTRAFQNAYLQFHDDPSFHDRLYPDADATLRAVKADDWLMGMATGNSRRGVNRHLDTHDWRDLFDVTICADDGPSKPHPHMVERNLAALGVATHEAVMIGDATHDIRMARNAGIHAIGVSWGFHTVAELEDAGAHEVVHDFAQLRAALENFSALRTAAFSGE